jgi:hypothetical protein
MAYRLSSLVLVATAAATTAAACGGGGDAEGRQGKPPGRAALAGTSYTSDQLQQALLTQAPGYRRNGEPDSGEYGALKAIQNFGQLRKQVGVDKIACRAEGNAGPGGPPVDPGTPAAITSFTRGNGQSVTETLMAMDADDADRHVNARVPAECRTFRTRIGGQWATHRVVDAESTLIGGGARTLGVATHSGGSSLKSWYVVVRGRRYLATISLVGPAATGAEAEQLARLADAQARRILP